MTRWCCPTATSSSGPDYLRGLTALLGVAAHRRRDLPLSRHQRRRRYGRGCPLSPSTRNFLPQAVTAVSLGLAKPCCGATIALRRSTLDRIGGFGALADILADDHAIGLAMRAAGYELVTAPFLVGHRCFEESLTQFDPTPDPGRPHHQEHRSDRLRRHDRDPSLAARPSRPAARAAPPRLMVDHRGTALARDAVPLRRTAVRACRDRIIGSIPVHDLIAFARLCRRASSGRRFIGAGADYRMTADGTLIEGQDLRGS